MKTVSKIAVSIGVFVMFFAITIVPTFAYTLDFGGADYGYSSTPASYDFGGADYGYSYSSPSYDYGGADYGYNYSTPSYDYGGADYGYNYSTPSYDYGGADYGYNYSTPSYDYGGADYGYTYADTSYDYGGADYGYTYANASYDYGGADYGYSYTPASYDYGGADYGSYTPAEYVPYVPEYPVIVDYGNSYVYPSSPSYSYGGGGYYGGGGGFIGGGGYSYSYPSYNYTSHTSRRPVCELYADDDRLTKGESTRLVWRTTFSDDQEINQGIGDVADDGSRSVSPTRTTTYTLFVEGDGGTVTCNETIFVDEPRNDLACDLFSVSDSRVEKGDRVTLTWRTTGADDVDINNGVGDVPEDGSEEVRINDDTTFTLTARDGNDSVDCTVWVEVDERDNDNVRCDSFTVSDSKVDKGDKVTLEWRTTDATSVRINNGVGSVDDDGDKRVTIDDDTTFTLTAKNGNDEDTCKVKVSVDDKKDSSNLRCELTASDRTVASGDEVKLSWDNRNADRIVLKDNHGKEIADSKDDRGIDEDTDSVKVKPKKDTEYTLTVYDGRQKRTCTVNVNVGDTNITSVRGQGTIPLSYTPYTGFDAGPTLTFIFYAVIVLWGAFVGYMLVLKKKAALALSHGVATTVHAGIVAGVATAHAPVAHVSDTAIPVNLPMVEDTSAIVGTLETDTLRILEERANAQSVLISSDALRLIESQNGTHEEQAATLDRVIALAKAQYPKENGWIVVNKEKLVALLS